jgi:SAM-dependent methyltransferase
MVAVGSRFFADLIARFYDEYIPKYAKGKLVDLGCGEVPLYAAYGQYVDEVICVDWMNSFHRASHLDLACDLNQQFPFKDNVFDTAILSDVLEHIADPARMVSEISRILKPGGILFLNVPFYYCLHEIPYDYYRYTEFALKRFAVNFNLEIKILEAIGGTVEVLTDIFIKHLQFVPVFGKGMAKILQNAVMNSLKISIVKKFSDITKVHFPLGYFFIGEKRR